MERERVGIRFIASVGDTLLMQKYLWKIFIDHGNPEIIFIPTSNTPSIGIVPPLLEGIPNSSIVDVEVKISAMNSRERAMRIGRKYNLDFLYNFGPPSEPVHNLVWNIRTGKLIEKDIQGFCKPFEKFYENSVERVMEYIDPYKINVTIHRYTGYNDIDWCRSRNLDEATWNKIIRLLKKLGFRIILLGADDDPYEVPDIVDVNLLNKLSITESLSLARISDIHIGAISGLFHYAACYGPTIGFGPLSQHEEMRRYWFAGPCAKLLRNVKLIDSDNVDIEYLKKAIGEIRMDFIRRGNELHNLLNNITNILK